MSKCGIVMLLAITGVIFAFADVMLGFGNRATHPALTGISVEGSRVDDYVKDQLHMANGIQTQLKYQPEWYQMYIEYRLQRGGYSAGGNNRTVLEWLRGGSVIEDEDLDVLPLFPNIRPRHHFHDPIRNTGLDNKTDHPNYSNLFAWATHFYPGEFDVTGQSAATWAIEGDAQREPTVNDESWSVAQERNSGE